MAIATLQLRRRPRNRQLPQAFRADCRQILPVLHQQLMTVLPVSTTVGFVTADGFVTDKAEDLPADVQALYGDYRLMAYNYIFDENHHPENFYSPPA